MIWMGGGGSAICCQPAFWLLIFVASLGLVLAVGSTAGLARAAWFAGAAELAISRLVVVPAPLALREAVVRAGAGNVRCVDSVSADAFCAGLFRPRVYVTTALARRLGADELEAVLLHEAEHARRRDPLRRALSRGFAQGFFFLPILRWWSNHELESSEVRADRCAIDSIGPRPLAAALWALSDESGLGIVPAFAGTAELRVAQILGDPLPRRSPSAWLWVVSGAGLTGVAYLLSCPTSFLLTH